MAVNLQSSVENSTGLCTGDRQSPLRNRGCVDLVVEVGIWVIRFLLCVEMVNESGVFDEDWLGFEWSSWRRLESEADVLAGFSTDPGLYRVRHDAYDGLIYIGETGRSLRGRLRALFRGIYDGEMPYNDPHTASPSFWAIVDRHGPGFEVSGTTPDVATDSQQRKAIEDALIAVHRRETETNLVGNFGRMPPGYSKSKSRSTDVRGGLCTDKTLRSFREGVDPLPWTNNDDVTANDWMGLDWSGPQPLADVESTVPEEPGVYRIWDDEVVPPLEYLGETVNLRSRFTRHRRNRGDHLVYSYTILPEYDEKFQLSQVESELLGAHWLACGAAPRDQY